MNNVFRIENVATQPAERITANDEERQRQGFELQTTFEWAVREQVLDVRHGAAADGDGEVLRLAYGPGATITRLNKGLRRRANRRQLGFQIDPVSGFWAKNDDEGDEPLDPTVAPRQWIVPSVQDRKNALLVQAAEADLEQTTIVTIQHAMLRGIETVFQLEEGEILAEPMPSRDARNGFLLYEATEGGAGVLTRLVAEPEKVAEIARVALKIMHFDVEGQGGLPGGARACSTYQGRSAWRPATAASCPTSTSPTTSCSTGATRRRGRSCSASHVPRRRVLHRGGRRRRPAAPGRGAAVAGRRHAGRRVARQGYGPGPSSA